MHGLEAEYDDKIQFTYLDIDDPNTDTFKATLGFRVQPQLFLLNGEGQVLQQWVGFVSRDEFVSAFEAALE